MVLREPRSWSRTVKARSVRRTRRFSSARSTTSQRTEPRAGMQMKESAASLKSRTSSCPDVQFNRAASITVLAGPCMTRIGTEMNSRSLFKDGSTTSLRMALDTRLTRSLACRIKRTCTLSCRCRDSLTQAAMATRGQPLTWRKPAAKSSSCSYK